MKSTRTIKTEVVSSKPDEIIFKLQQEYTPKPMPIAKKVNSLITLTLDEEGKVRYHKVRCVRGPRLLPSSSRCSQPHPNFLLTCTGYVEREGLLS
jgi:hypothetical protein